MRVLRLVLCLLVLAPLGHACSIIVGARFQPSFWHRLTDFSAPTPPRVLSGPDALRRGIGPQLSESGMMSSTSCDDIGLFSLDLAASTDSRTQAHEIGYEVEVTSGTPPAGMFEREPQTLALDARTEPSPANLTFVWIDGATDVQEPLDVRFVLRAVDRAGNWSAPSDTVHVLHPGFEAGATRRDSTGAPLR